MVGLAACNADDPPVADQVVLEPTPAASAPDAFWANLEYHCGQAFRGELGFALPGDDMVLPGEELVVHMRQCGADTLKLPFHIDKEDTGWDRSRTWVFMQTGDGLELRHDHRHEDGTVEDSSWYGASTVEEGTAERQEFMRSGAPSSDGSTGWRVEIVPDERYTYGTIRNQEWTWRVDFDLTEPIEPPPAPWGHEDTQPTM